MILLWTLIALHYGKWTAAWFIFPTVLMVVMLRGPALPDTPLNC